MVDSICTAVQLLNHLQDLGAICANGIASTSARGPRAVRAVGETLRARGRRGCSVRAFVLHWADRIGAQFAAGWPLDRARERALRWETACDPARRSGRVARIRLAVATCSANAVHFGTLERHGCPARGTGRRSAPQFTAVRA
jgi:hypothetical protein